MNLRVAFNTLQKSHVYLYFFDIRPAKYKEFDYKIIELQGTNKSKKCIDEGYISLAEKSIVLEKKGKVNNLKVAAGDDKVIKLIENEVMSKECKKSENMDMEKYTFGKFINTDEIKYIEVNDNKYYAKNSEEGIKENSEDEFLSMESYNIRMKMVLWLISQV